MTPLLSPAAIAAVTTAALIPILRHLALRHDYLDVPNEQSSHARPTPRVGGYAMLAGVVAGISVAGAWRGSTVAAIVAGALALGALAYADDRRSLPRVLRLIMQLAVAALVVWTIRPSSILVSLGAIVWLVAVINAYNFMDGLNGMAGIGAVVTGSALAALAWRQGDGPAAILALSMAAAAAGFLPFNLFSGSVFMGDAGSTALGLVFGSLALDAVARSGIGIAAMLPLAPFVLDAWTTIIRRALRRERFFSTRHRTSYYQLLQQLGWRHEAVAGLYGLLTLVCAGVALAFESLSTTQRGLALGALAIGHAVIFLSISRSFHAARLHREA